MRCAKSPGSCARVSSGRRSTTAARLKSEIGVAAPPRNNAASASRHRDHGDRRRLRRLARSPPEARPGAGAARGSRDGAACGSGPARAPAPRASPGAAGQIRAHARHLHRRAREKGRRALHAAQRADDFRCRFVSIRRPLARADCENLLDAPGVGLGEGLRGGAARLPAARPQRQRGGQRADRGDARHGVGEGVGSTSSATWRCCSG